MAQIKKTEVRDAILNAAFRLFSAQGYSATALTAISKAAGISKANLYVYFDSKLDILYTIYEPWMRTRIARLEADIAQVPDSRGKLRTLIRALWRDIPSEENGFVNNIMQALSSALPVDQYRPTLVNWLEERITALLETILSPDRLKLFQGTRIAQILIMALDGYAIHYHLRPKEDDVDDASIEAMVSLILGGPGPAPRG